jgi:hypothetical protein
VVHEEYRPTSSVEQNDREEVGLEVPMVTTTRRHAGRPHIVNSLYQTRGDSVAEVTKATSMH